MKWDVLAQEKREETSKTCFFFTFCDCDEKRTIKVKSRSIPDTANRENGEFIDKFKTQLHIRRHYSDFNECATEIKGEIM